MKHGARIKEEWLQLSLELFIQIKQMEKVHKKPLANSEFKKLQNL